MEKKPYYITTAIAYTSRKPHIGNSYEIVLADALARFKRMQGYDVFFQTGTDEHGQKIEEYAAEAGISPKEYVDKVAGEIKDVCDCLNTTYDKFIRTTDEDHEKSVQKIFEKLYNQGDIYKSEYEGWYCVPCESFFTETQLVDGKCPDCGREVRKEKEEAYFFKMSKYQKQLEEYIEQNPDFIYPESRKKEMINNFIKPGLQDLCVSRSSFKWGVPVALMTNTLSMCGLMHFQTTLQVSVTIQKNIQKCIKNTGLQMFILSVKIFFVSTQFTGRLCLWHWASHFRNKFSVTRGFSPVKIKCQSHAVT